MKKETKFNKFDSVSIFCSYSNQEIKGFVLGTKHVDVYSENRWGQLEYTHTEYRVVCILTMRDGEYVPVAYRPVKTKINGRKTHVGVSITRTVLFEKDIASRYKNFEPVLGIRFID